MAIAATRVRTAVIAAAGLGTRLLPQTKAMPKEMLPVVDKPVIQYIVEELVDAGIENIVIVTGYHKRSIEDHFDCANEELRRDLRSSDNGEMLAAVEQVAHLANFAYVRQKGPRGNGAPLLSAASLIGNEPFIYTFGDDFIRASPSRFRQMVEIFEETGRGVLSCIRATRASDYERYGFVSGRVLAPSLIEVESIVEKPGEARAPSDLASVSSYLLLPSVFTYLKAELTVVGERDELSIQRALQRSIDDGNQPLAYEVANARYYDVGNKLEYLKTMVSIGLDHPEIADDLLEFLVQEISAREMSALVSP